MASLLAYLIFIARPKAETTFVLMKQNAMITKTRAAILTRKLIATPNIVSALAAFYSAVDKLKHLLLLL
jgi:hypothetical protein